MVFTTECIISLLSFLLVRHRRIWRWRSTQAAKNSSSMIKPAAESQYFCFSPELVIAEKTKPTKARWRTLQVLSSDLIKRIKTASLGASMNTEHDNETAETIILMVYGSTKSEAMISRISLTKSSFHSSVVKI